MKVQPFALIEHTSVEATYKTGSETIRIWATNDGTLNLAFADFSFKGTFNKVERFSIERWPWPAKNHPRLDDLEGGVSTALSWLNRAVSARDTRYGRQRELIAIVSQPKKFEPRFEGLEYTSWRFHDKEKRAYFTCRFSLIEGKVPVVTTHTPSTSRRDDDLIRRCASPAWRFLASRVNPVFDAHEGVDGLEGLSEEVYEGLKGAFVRFRELERQKTQPSADVDDVEK